MECQTSSEHGHGARPHPARPPPPTQSTSQRQNIVTFTDFKKCYHQATQSAEKGLTYDEEDRNSDAIATYTQAVESINQVLAVDCVKIPGASADEVNSAKEMQLKLTKTKLQVEYRLQALQAVPSASNGPTMADLMEMQSPPSYEEVMSADSAASVAQNGDAEMMALGDSIMAQETPGRSVVANATRVFEIPDGVQIFFITPEGYVSAPSYPSSLQVFKFLGQTVQMGATAEQQPPAFMQVNDWVYPLIPDTSPALHTSYGAYMFPDTASQAPGAAVGLILPEGLSEATKEQFETLMRSLTVMEDQSPEAASYVPPATRTQEQVSQPQKTHEIGEQEDEENRESTTARKISKAADWISWGVQKGAQKAGKLIHYGSEKVQQRIYPKGEESKVHPDVQKAAEYIRTGTHVATTVSSFVVTKLGEATAAMGRYLAPHVRKQGGKLLNKSGLVKTSSGKSKMDGVLEVAASGIQGFGTVYMSLEAAAIELARNIANETVDIVNLKYGNQAGNLTENTLYSVGNVAMTTHHIKNLGIKAVAKRAAKETGKAVINDLQDNSTSKEKSEPHASKDVSSEQKKKPM
ncbi:spartin-like isoform X2 [Gigantopelta aegis]|uniref:spartin-like isoform X2 n=1 Tax=Gigantopelta aegis TaxID=1735272 RepID=UPI001B8894D7|nr:spartin-like isoform X2 [Gigantopelta aegis]